MNLVAGDWVWSPCRGRDLPSWSDLPKHWWHFQGPAVTHAQKHTQPTYSGIDHKLFCMQVVCLNASECEHTDYICLSHQSTVNRDSLAGSLSRGSRAFESLRTSQVYKVKLGHQCFELRLSDGAGVHAVNLPVLRFSILLARVSEKLFENCNYFITLLCLYFLLHLQIHIHISLSLLQPKPLSHHLQLLADPHLTEVDGEDGVRAGALGVHLGAGCGAGQGAELQTLQQLQQTQTQCGGRLVVTFYFWIEGERRNLITNRDHLLIS